MIRKEFSSSRRESSNNASSADEAFATNTPPLSTDTSSVLRSLFQARQVQDTENRTSGMGLSMTLNPPPERTSPLMADTMASTSLFCQDDFLSSKTSSPHQAHHPRWKQNCLFHHLGQQKIQKRITNNNASLFSASLNTDSFLSNINNNRAMTGDEDLDNTIRSFSNKLKRKRAVPAAADGRSGLYCHKRPKQFPIRYRIVNQVVGQKGAQRVLALVKEIHQIRAAECSSSVEEEKPKQIGDIWNCRIVDAWENTPLEDMNRVHWEELISAAQNSVDAFRAWQKDTSTGEM